MGDIVIQDLLYSLLSATALVAIEVMTDSIGTPRSNLIVESAARLNPRNRCLAPRCI